MRRAFTLPEIMVSVFLLGTVMALVIGLLFPSMFLFKAESARGDAQQAAMLLTTRLQRGLLNSSIEWVTLSATPVAVSFREINPSSPYNPVDGTAQWLPCFQIVRFDAAAHKVFQKAWPPGPPEPNAGTLDQAYDFGHWALPKLTINDLADICNAPAPKERTLADSVESLSITDQDGEPGLLHPPFTIAAVCSVPNHGQGKQTVERYELTVSVTPRCQRW